MTMKSMFLRSLTATCACLMALCLQACPPSNPAVTVTVTAADDSLTVGDTATLTAVSTDDKDALFTWTASVDGVVAISAKLDAGATVTVEAVGEGTVEVTATGLNSGQSGSVTLTIAPQPGPSHAGRYTVYEGSKTCRGCHSAETSAVHASVHYQWNGDAPELINADTGGKLNGMNDFCTSPSINWIGILTDLQGVSKSAGCAQCHVGMGAKPSADATTEQLNNIDCLMCHSNSYKRKVVKNADDSLGFAPDEDKMTVPLLEAITDITSDLKGTCLDCHAYAGGGQNNKRGDIEEAHRNASADFDVHMAPVSAGGAGLVCADCHTMQNHRVAGRGSDLRPNDLNVTVQCENCHDAQPHSSERLNAHTAKVNCTVCHIPAFARGSSTEMHRDFTEPEVHPSKQLYEPTLTRESNVQPQLRFWNGTSYVYSMGEEAVADPLTNVTSLAYPVGDVNDANAKLHGFKRHTCEQPIDPESGRLIPLKMGVYFTKGDLAGAVNAGAAALGWELPQGYAIEDTERWMGIFHEVAPSSNALSCTDCHGPNGRLDGEFLGYTPKETLGEKPLCAACHEDQSATLNDSEAFFEVHEEHVDEKGLACSVCHEFSR